MLAGRTVSGILAVLGVALLVRSFSIEDIGSCPLVIAGQQSSCSHYYPGTSIYVSTIWLVLNGLSALSFGAAAIVFLASTRHEHRTRMDPTRTVDAVFGMVLMSVTTGLAAGGLIEPAIFGFPFFRITGFLYGIAFGLIPGTIFYLLPHQNVVSSKPEIS